MEEKQEMSLATYIIKRTIQIAITLFVVITILFFLFRVMPGDPTAFLLDPKMSPEAKEIIRKQFGLDKPLYVQYVLYVRNVLKGDFGTSFYYGVPVFERIKELLPNTLLLWVPAILLSYFIGINVGRRIAWKRGSKEEYIMIVLGLFFLGMPIFWFGMIMIWLFYHELGIFPAGGMMTPELWLDPSTPLWKKVADIVYHLLLPIITLSIGGFAGSMLLMRNSMLDTLREDYITTARAKGLKESVIRDKHAARNAMLPIVTAMSISLAFSAGGGVLTETIFSWPGLGREIVQAVLNYDYPLAQAAFFYISVIVLFANLVADVLYAYLDPRIKY